MEFGPATFGLGYLAGALSALSPCVLPLLPILLAAALLQHRWGALALAAGLTCSYAVVGLLLARLGAALGAEFAALRQLSAVLMVACGAWMLEPAWQRATARLGAGAGAYVSRRSGSGAWGQFALGGVLGVAWTPCVGPTLGAAVAVATQGRQLADVAGLMLLFGLGAATPLLLLGLVSREALSHW